MPGPRGPLRPGRPPRVPCGSPQGGGPHSALAGLEDDRAVRTDLAPDRVGVAERRRRQAGSNLLAPYGELPDAVPVVLDQDQGTCGKFF